jgi:hypothetical protein
VSEGNGEHTASATGRAEAMPISPGRPRRRGRRGRSDGAQRPSGLPLPGTELLARLSPAHRARPAGAGTERPYVPQPGTAAGTLCRCHRRRLSEQDRMPHEKPGLSNSAPPQPTGASRVTVRRAVVIPAVAGDPRAALAPRGSDQAAATAVVRAVPERAVLPAPELSPAPEPAKSSAEKNSLKHQATTSPSRNTRDAHAPTRSPPAPLAAATV